MCATISDKYKIACYLTTLEKCFSHAILRADSSFGIEPLLSQSLSLKRWSDCEYSKGSSAASHG